MTGPTGAQPSIMNNCSATANLELGELCPSLGTLVYAGRRRGGASANRPLGAVRGGGARAELREPSRTGHTREVH